jgi:hypothetical protein
MCCHCVVLQRFEEHNEQVRRTVPTSQLLEFNVSQGWQPLCEFLNVPVPSQPFPNSNSTAEFQARIAERDRFFQNVALSTAFAVVVGGAIAAYAYYSSNRSSAL